MDNLDPDTYETPEEAWARVEDEAEEIGEYEEPEKRDETGHFPGCASQTFPNPGICFCDQRG